MNRKFEAVTILEILPILLTTMEVFAQGSDLLSTVRNNDLEAVKDLVDAGADVDMEDDMMGCTPLYLAISGGNKDMVELLLSLGADINKADKRTGYTPLMMALNSKNGDLAKFLIEKGADYNIKGHDGATALILTCGVSPDLSKFLLSIGADIHAQTDKGLGVFSQCVTMGLMGGNEKITPQFAEFLLSKGANIDEKNTLGVYKGYTPLIWAVLYGETDVVKFLAEKGADVNAVAENGKSPMSMASETGNEAIVKILKGHGAK